MEVVNIKSNNELSSFYIVYYGSCNLERKGIYGISHLMEHLVCSLFDDMQNEFDENGISWNAYTSSNEIVFHWSGLEENLKKYRSKFVNLLKEFNITEEKFENERNIVIQEYYDSFNDQFSSHYFNLNRKLLNHYAPIGLLEDLKSLTFKDCQDYFELQYKNIDKIINVSQEDFISTETKEEETLKSFSDFSLDPFKYTYKKNDDASLEILNKFEGKRSVIFHSDVIHELDDYAKIQMIISLLSSGLNSPLYQEIREKKGLVYYIQSFIENFGSNYIIYFCSLTTDDNVEEFKKAFNEVINNPEKYLTQERFDIIKKKLMISYKKRNVNNFSNVDKYIDPKEFVLENYIEDLTLESCMEVYDYFKSLIFSTDKDF